jgi:hypothetical protein
MIVSYLVSKLALSDSKDFISKNFLKLLIINIILRIFPYIILLIGSWFLYLSLLPSSNLDIILAFMNPSEFLSKILGLTFFLLIMLIIFYFTINYIYEKSIVYFIARKENDKYRTFLKWAILDTSIIKSIKSFIGYILINIFYAIVISGTIYVITMIFQLLLLLTGLLLPIVTVIVLILLIISISLLLIFIQFLGSYTSKSYFFARVSNPSNWSSLKMAFSSISGKVIKRILKLVLYALITTIIIIITLLAILFAIRFVGLDLDLIIILFVIILIYLFTEWIAYNVISDLYILNIIKTNSQSEMGQNAEQSK